MTENPIDAFARLLAAEENGAKRAALIERAKQIAMGQAREEAFEPPITTLGEYLETPIPIPPSLVWPTIVVRGEITATLGKSGKGKTSMNLCRLMRWGAGKPLADSFTNKDGDHYLKPSGPLKILIIENEGSAGMFHQKVGIMMNNCGDLLNDDDRDLIRENVHIWGDGGYSGLKLDDPAMLSNVRAGCEKVDPDIVFIEPFRSLWRGEENSSTDMAVIADNLVALATDYDCGVIISHHERKSGPGEDGELMSVARGSTVLEGVVAVMEHWQSVVKGDYREMTWSKNRYLQSPPPTRFKYDIETSWYKHVPIDDIQNRIIECLREHPEEALSVKELKDELNESETKLRPILNDLTSKERLKALPNVSTGEGSSGKRYRLPGDENEYGGIPV